MMNRMFYPLNDSMADPNVRGDAPEGFCIIKDITVGAMTAGKVVVELTNIPFGKNLGEVWGAEIINGADAAGVMNGGSESDLNSVLTAGSAVVGTHTGDVDVVIVCTDATKTTNTYVVTLKIYGKILPLNA